MFVGDRADTQLIFNIDIIMIIFIFKHSMNTKILGSLKTLYLASRLNSDKNPSNTRKYTFS